MRHSVNSIITSAGEIAEPEAEAVSVEQRIARAPLAIKREPHAVARKPTVR